MEDYTRKFDANEYPPVSIAEMETLAETPKETRQEEIVKSAETEAPIYKSKKKTKTYTAKVITKTRDSHVGVEFEGYGISIKTEKAYVPGDTIELEYKSEIGKPDFKVWAA